jgi:predicted nucleotidyltransferase
LAVETGSRAWGFASPDSDFDVRLIYVKHQDWYISISERKDHLEYMSADGELDLTGWELRKALRLLAKSNAAMLERIQSPIVYVQDGNFAAEMQQLAHNFYSPVAVMHHYYSMAGKSFEAIDGAEKYKLKALFYALRATCACLWVLQQETYPPIVFADLLKGISISDELRSKIAKLTELKATKSESYLHTGENDLIDFIKSSLAKAKVEKQSLKSGKGSQRRMEQLDVFLRSKIIEQ